jgi:dihydroorotase
MENKILIKNARIVNEGTIMEGDLMIEKGRIAKIDTHLSQPDSNTTVIDAAGKFLLPGVIDDQVHFREPGLTHKGDIYTESRAAAAGGITSYIEQPNTNPQATTLELLEAKYDIAAQQSMVNYAFNLGATNSNVDEIKKADPKRIPGTKVFMGSSTGNMLVNELEALEAIFANSPIPVITHCEDEKTIVYNLEQHRDLYGDDIPMKFHPLIRSREACFKSSSMAVELARKHGTRLHVYHISTKEEVKLFSNKLTLPEKKITAEACIHHLWFDADDYEEKGSLIKWNPAVKNAEDREAIFKGVLEGYIDVIATDHAPHTLQEKQQVYTKAPSGGPLVQHALPAMMEFVRDEKMTIEQLVEKMCHNPATLFNIKDRGFLREGYFADLVLLDAFQPWTVNKDNILYKCGWSPFEGQTFKARIAITFVNGVIVYENGKLTNAKPAMRLAFDR